MDIQVKVADKIKRRDFNPVFEQKRIEHKGETGQIVGQNRGHGVCYRVRFPNGASAWYDPDELQLV